MTEIYNEQMEKIENPDLSLGYLKSSTRTEYHEAIEGVEEVWHYETIAEYPNGGKDVAKVIDVPGVEAKAAWDEEIPIQIYIPYTEEELETIKNTPIQLSSEERILALEQRNAELEKILNTLLEKLNDEDK